MVKYTVVFISTDKVGELEHTENYQLEFSNDSEYNSEIVTDLLNQILEVSKKQQIKEDNYKSLN